jgi:cholesterol transport system auxiliary component
MKISVTGFLIFFIALLNMGCSFSPKQTILHDFGLPNFVSTNKVIPTGGVGITVDAPTWLWDNRLRYRLLYAPQTRIGFYALDLWVAPPPELFEQLLISSGKIKNYALIISLKSFEQQFDEPNRSRVVMSFLVEAYSVDKKTKIGVQAFYLEQTAIPANAAGAINGFANLTRQAADKIQIWLVGLSDKSIKKL